MNQEQRVFDLSSQNPSVMWEIVKRMKVIDELPSDKPNDVQPLTRVEFAEKGGVLTHMGTMPFPYKGFPFFEFVDKIDVLKKLFRGFLSGAYHEFKRKKLLLIILLPLVKPLSRVALYVAHRHIDRFMLKREMYCDAVRALYKGFTYERMTQFQVMFRDTLCMVLEMDNAYRYRFQDVIVNLDKYALCKNPRKELLRLLAILSQRERTQDVKDTWTLIRIAISVYLFVDKQFRNNLVRGLTSVDLSEMQLSVEDKLYAAGRKDYVFDFMVTPDKEGAYCLKHNQLKDEWVKKVQEVREHSTQIHQDMFKRHDLEQKLIAPKVSDEEIARINTEINEKAQELMKQRDSVIQNHQLKERDLVTPYLTPQQIRLSEIQAEQIKKMDEEWTAKITELDDSYQKDLEKIKSLLQ